MATRSTYRPPLTWDKPLIRVDSITSLASFSSSSECSFEGDDDDDGAIIPHSSSSDLTTSYQTLTDPALNDSMFSLDSTTTDRSSSSTTTTSSGITFYQSSLQFHYMDRDAPSKATTTPRSNRGIDRNISMPRERHSASDVSLSSVTMRDIVTNSPKRTMPRTIRRTISEHSNHRPPLAVSNHHHHHNLPCSSPNCVSPEVTRPKVLRHPSTSSTSYASPVPTISTHQRIPMSRYPSTPSAAAPTTRPLPPPSLRVPSLRPNAPHRARSIVPAPTPAVNTTNAQPPPPTTTNDKVLLEIAPGVKLHLRGAEETQAAMANGFYVQCECFLCSSSENLYCILDCDYFLCPDCRSVYPNPISTHHGQDMSSSTRPVGGLGLGFRMSERSCTADSSAGERVTL